MADKIGGVYIEIQAKMGSLEADLKRLESKLQQTDKSGLSLKEQFRRISESASLFGTKTTELINKNTALRAKMEELIAKGVNPANKGFAKLKEQYDANKKSIDSLNEKTEKTSSVFSSFGKYLTTGVIAAGLLNIGKSALQAAANMEQNRVAFTTMLSSADKADKLLQQIQAFAESTPFQFNDLVDASKRMIAFGFSLDEVIGKLEMVGNVAAGLGQPIGDMIYLFGQVKTQGKAMTQDLNQFAGRGVPIFEEVAKAMGVTKEQVRKLAEQGKITYDVIEKSFQNMTGEGGKFANLMSNQSNTLAGKWSNLNDQLDKTAVLLGQTMATSAKDMVGIMSNLLGIANGLISKYNEMSSSQKHNVGMLESINNGLNDSGEKLQAIFKYEKQNAQAAYKYTEYLSGHIALSDVEISKLQEVLKLNRTISEIIKDTTTDVEKQGNFISGQVGDMLQYIAALEKVQKNTKGKGAPDPEAVKKWQAAKKAAEDLGKAINQGYVSALGTADEKLDLEKQKIDEQAQSVAKNYQKRLITIDQYLKQKEQLEAQYDALERSRFERNLEDMANKYNQFTQGLTQLSGQLSQLVTMNASNQTTEIDNKLQAQLDAIDATYQKEVENINNSVMSETEKNAALKALDEQKARDEKAAQAKAEKEKRRIARDTAKIQKQISIFETVVTTPTAAMQAYKAMAGIPIVGPALGAIAAAAATALGIAKIKLIKDQPLPALAQGGIIPASPQGTQFIAGEAGSSEAVIPLNSQGINILKTALQGASGQPIYINNVITLDGEVIYKDLYRATRDGRVQIAQRAVV